MTTVLLRNNTKLELSPLGSKIKPGATIAVSNWEYKEGNDQLQALLRAKALEVVGEGSTQKARKAALDKPMPSADDPVRNMGPGVDVYQPAPDGGEESGTEAKAHEVSATRRTRRG